ncbi:N-acetylmuramic acid 6-phosphate etherase [Secundilactobacillus paracollinoides]|uniref:N-acetylmuramic acid 6-phosphate etherase n=1 Tax=Secundilactobacillus paracollinoides TaxID=240427 RepID=A0A1B2J077_9LACO|nr:N-acetylmuramic acid 6-phosphate etherase [Secundilactobacillus paracollinoides]ANZ61778.1 N-acetylmuramic acid 6-phosphate etherase [Secundilactobacillus paracollinoides]ANZ63414.1 N-acetylmuramic acid 6-phosphate etherase [Secundilactobacillus paracollinoides]ANZ67697.1 N-acetylmuramic acid 6-phosphate etherase [Secundilactobacillus paracollinoides]
MNFEDLLTEQRNRHSTHIDQADSNEMVDIINREDQRVGRSVQKQLPQVAEAINLATKRFDKGGRLIYIGAGTSGRLGVLDATELRPTYGLEESQTFGIIAGGPEAMFHTIEGVEDSGELAEENLKDASVTEKDIVIGIAASGATNYTVSALAYAKKQGALTIALACVPESPLEKNADVAICPIVGPEVITGATLMKAGTAQKMVLNMLSSGIMIRSGKVYQNLMINVTPTNEKTQRRAKRIIAAATQTSTLAAERALARADNNVPLAILLIETKGTIAEAKKLLAQSGGHVSDAVKLSLQ